MVPIYDLLTRLYNRAYGSRSAIACRPCAAGEITNEETGKATCFVCAPQATNRNKTACVNAFCSYLISRQTGVFCRHGNCTSSTQCEPCDVGKVTSDGVDCQSCADRGKVASLDRSVCESCPAAKSPNSERSACEPCSGSTFSTFGFECQSCLTGSRPNTERTFCEPCGNNTDGIDCGECRPGFYSDKIPVNMSNKYTGAVCASPPTLAQNCLVMTAFISDASI